MKQEFAAAIYNHYKSDSTNKLLSPHFLLWLQRLLLRPARSLCRASDLFSCHIRIVGLLTGTWLTRRQYRRARVQRIRDQARLKVVESQIAALRAALRISIAKHVVRRAMAMQSRDPFANHTDHEEYRAS